MNPADFDLGRAVKEAVEGAMRELRTVNILIAGPSGVGKSTLINAIFSGNLAETGQGRPVTTSTREYWKEGLPLRVFDTRGLETAAYKETLGQLREFAEERKRDTSADRHIHVGWLCIAEDSRRVDQAVIETHDVLASSMPVVGVITKVRQDKGFRAVVQGLLPNARNIVRVRAEREEHDDGHILNPEGLEGLIELTLTLIPESHRRAFVAAQKASLAQKKKYAHGAVVTAATAAAGFAAAPIPFSDAIAIVPVQVGMLAGISATFGLELSAAFLSTLVVSAAGAGGATLAGQALVGALLKIIPGVGSVTGGLVSAAVASALTVALGETYILALSILYDAKGGEVPTPAEVEAEFKKQLTLRGTSTS